MRIYWGGRSSGGYCDNGRNADKFNLSDHGDRHEQEGWKLIQDRFPNYEIFWRLYVVPLTNRTSPGARDSSWIRLRSDVPAEWETLAVCHYSVFYYLARAARRRIECVGNAGGPIHPEDVIYLLQTCCENVQYFYAALRAVAGGAASHVPLGIPEDFPFREIKAYRNLFLHNPVLGRGESDGETLLPKLPSGPEDFDAWKRRFKFSWRAVERLDARDLVSARSLLQAYEDGLAKYLNETWAKLISNLGPCNLHERFPFLRLPDPVAAVQFSNRIDTDSSCVNVGQPMTASATFNSLRISGPEKGKMMR